MKEQLQQTTFDFTGAQTRLSKVARKTPLVFNQHLSLKYDCSVYLKREDLQVVRSYKLRGAYNMISLLDEEQRKQGVVCASAGNHAQGFAFSCRRLGIYGIIFMPLITPQQKITQTRMFGDGYIEIRLAGDTYDECAQIAQYYSKENQKTFIPAFDNNRIIEGQGTVALEILEEMSGFDYVIVPVGGGGLCAGVGACLATYSPAVKIIAVEPAGAPSMTKALEAGHPVTLSSIDGFVDGAAVKRVGDLTFSICKDVIYEMGIVEEGKICSTILELYNKEAIVVEPAGALSIAALDQFAGLIKGKKIVCIISGSNNDIDRMPEIRERSLRFEGLKHYFIVNFAQRPGALKEFVNDVLGPTDDITRFEYMKKTAKENGPALIGVELKNREDYDMLLANMKRLEVQYKELVQDDPLFAYVV